MYQTTQLFYLKKCHCSTTSQKEKYMDINMNQIVSSLIHHASNFHLYIYSILTRSFQQKGLRLSRLRNISECRSQSTELVIWNMIVWMSTPFAIITVSTVCYHYDNIKMTDVLVNCQKDDIYYRNRHSCLLDYVVVPQLKVVVPQLNGV